MFDDIMNVTVYITIIVLICCLLSFSMLLNKGNTKKSLIYNWLLCKLLVTLITSILDTLMYRENMLCQITLVSSSIVTLVTSIHDTFMYRLNVSSQTGLIWILMVTLITSKLDTLMYGFNVNWILFKSTILKINWFLFILSLFIWAWTIASCSSLSFYKSASQTNIIYELNTSVTRSQNITYLPKTPEYKYTRSCWPDNKASKSRAAKD